MKNCILFEKASIELKMSKSTFITKRDFEVVESYLRGELQKRFFKKLSGRGPQSFYWERETMNIYASAASQSE